MFLVKTFKIRSLLFVVTALSTTSTTTTLFTVLISHQALAQTQSCKNLLTSSTTLKWHVVGEHFGQNSTYRAAKRRFNIKDDVKITPREEVTSFFNQIDKRYSLALKDESALEELRSEWLERALIKKIPKNHIKHPIFMEGLNERGVDLGQNFSEEYKLKQVLKILQEPQRESFLRWFNHIMGPDVVGVPPWLRYILLEELLEIGMYNPTKNSFSQRTYETVEPYPQLNGAVFTRVYTSLKSYYEGDSSIEPSLLKLIKKNESRAFANIYAQRISELKELAVKFNPKETEGEWIRYERGNTNHAQNLFDSLQYQNTGWCSADACSTATTQIDYGQIDYGDFYVYYSKDNNGEFTTPRIAIHMEDERIVEVRGRANNQGLDLEIAKTSILEDKLKEFGDRGKRYKQRSQDMRFLIEIEAKVQSGDELSFDELKFLYEIERKIQGFGYTESPSRIDEIILQRDQLAQDYARIFNVQAGEVTSNKEDVLSGKAKVFIGTLYLEPEDDLSKVQLKAIVGNAYFYNLKSARGLETLTYIAGTVYFDNLTSARELESLTHIGGYAHFDNLKSARGLESLTYIGGNARFDNLENAEGLDKLIYIVGYAHFDNLKSARGLESLTYIDGNAHFNNLENAEGLDKLIYIGGKFFFNSMSQEDQKKFLIQVR